MTEVPNRCSPSMYRAGYSKGNWVQFNLNINAIFYSVPRYADSHFLKYRHMYMPDSTDRPPTCSNLAAAAAPQLKLQSLPTCPFPAKQAPLPHRSNPRLMQLMLSTPSHLLIATYHQPPSSRYVGTSYASVLPTPYSIIKWLASRQTRFLHARGLK